MKSPDHSRTGARPAIHENRHRLPTRTPSDKLFRRLRLLHVALLVLSPLSLVLAGVLAGRDAGAEWLILPVLLAIVLPLLHYYLYHSLPALQQMRESANQHLAGYIQRSQQKIRYLSSQLNEEVRQRQHLEQQVHKIESDTRQHIEERTRQLSETNELLNHQIKLRQEISDALARSQTRLSQAIEASNLGLWDWDLTTQTFYQSPFAQLFTQKELSSAAYMQQLKRMVHPEDYPKVRETMEKYFSNETELFKVCYRVHDAQHDQWRWIEDQGRAISRDKHNHVLRMLGTRRDITQERQRQEQLQLTQSVYDQTSEGIFVLNHRFEVVSVNQAFQRILGYNEQELVGKNWLDISHTPRKKKVFQQARIELAKTGYWEAELFEQRKNGYYFPMRIQVNTIHVPSSGASYFAGLISDQTQNKRADEKLRYLLNYDELTGLANRSLFKDRLHGALVRARNGTSHFALMSVDIDRFKHINQNLGHEQADTLLKHFAERLILLMNQADTVARLGHDEFAIILPIQSREDAAQSARRILQEVTKPYHIDHQDLLIATSIGITLFPDQGREIPQLHQQASTALRQAKYLGGNNFQFYNKALKDISKFRVRLESDLRKGLRNGELEVFYQPKLTLATRRIESVEALVRWNHPHQGMIHPSDFVNIAEESGLIAEIGETVMRSAFRQARYWLDEGLGSINIAINLSPYQLRQSDVTTRVARLLEETGLPPGQVELELTESALIENRQTSAKLLDQFKHMGIQLSVDDFGTGYSSFSYLRDLPVNALKIDRSFIQDVDTNEKDAAICKAIIAMAKTLGLRVVAEGVENARQLQFLAEAGCDIVQGYFLAKPLDPHAMTRMLSQQVTQPDFHSLPTLS